MHVDVNEQSTAGLFVRRVSAAAVLTLSLLALAQTAGAESSGPAAAPATEAVPAAAASEAPSAEASQAAPAAQSAPSAPAAATGTPGQPLKPPGIIAYEQRIGFVRTLLESSSATKQIDASGNAAAVAKREEAKARLKAAEEAHAKGDVEAASAMLVETTKIMFEAVRLAEPAEVVNAKKQQDYNRLLESINALLAAHERVSEDKKQVDGASLRQAVKDQVAKAQQQYDAGNYDEAQKLLDEAYVSAKGNIKTLRDGDTLVRSLDFATKEDEYKYELERNESQKLLVNTLLKEKGDKPGTAKLTGDLVAKSDALREEAQQQAAKGDHEGAIKTLEEATRQLGKAMQAMGIYVPL